MESGMSKERVFATLRKVTECLENVLKEYDCKCDHSVGVCFCPEWHLVRLGYEALGVKEKSGDTL